MPKSDPKQRIGTYPCLGCIKETPLNKSTKSGKLIAPCNWCDFTLYAPEGTVLYKNVMAKATLDAAPPAPEPQPGPGPKGAPAAAAAPAARSRPIFAGG
jgi:hypothetical protein